MQTLRPFSRLPGVLTGIALAILTAGPGLAAEAPVKALHLDGKASLVVANGPPIVVQVDGDQGTADEASAGLFFSGDWSSADLVPSDIAPIRKYWHSTRSGYARWRPAILRDGVYEVAAWWPLKNGTSSWATQALFQVIGPGGTVRTDLNQTMGGDSVSLGRHPFRASAPAEVRLLSGPAYGAEPVAAGAVQWRLSPFDFTGALTVEADVKNLSTQASGPLGEILAKGGAGLSAHVDWALLAASVEGGQQFCFRTRNGEVWDDLTFTKAGADNWLHVAAVLDGTEKRLYLDGALVASKKYDRYLEVSTLSAGLRIGTGISGLLDNVRIWSRARSQREIQVFRDIRLFGTEAGLEGSWRFDDNLLDHSARGRVMETSPSSSTVRFDEGKPMGFPPPGEYALSFNGRDQCVEFSDDPALDFKGPFTLETWVYSEQEPRSMFEASRFVGADIPESLVTELGGLVKGGTDKPALRYVLGKLSPPSPPEPFSTSSVAAALNALLLDPNLATVEAFKNGAPVSEPETDPGLGSEDAKIRKNRLILQQSITNLPKSFLGTALISKGTSAWRLLLMNDASVRFQTRHGEINDQGSSSTKRLTPGQWHHVAAVWDGERKFLFIDGRLDSSAAGPTNIPGKTLPVAHNNEPLQLGATVSPVSPNSNHRHFKGKLDEVRLWSAALPASYLSRIHNRKVAGTEPCLVGLWSFDEGGPYARGSDVGTGVASPGPQIIGGSIPRPEVNRVPGKILADPVSAETALELGEGSGFLEVSSASALSLTNFTFEAWVRPDPLADRVLVNQGSDQAQWSLRVTAQGRLEYHARSAGRSEQVAANSSHRLKEGVWQHVAVTVHRADPASVAFYVDGVPAGTQSISAPVPPGPSGGGLQIGGSFNEEVRFSGGLDEIRIWNRPRPPLLIAAFARLPLPDPARSRREEGLVAYWNFSEPPAANPETDDFGLTWRLNGGAADQPVVWKFGPDWGGTAVSGVSLSPNADPRMAGLWVGTVTLNKVNEVQTATPDDSGQVTFTADSAAFRILLHVDTGGQVRLLKDVVVVPRISTDLDITNASPVSNVALITRDEVLPRFLNPGNTKTSTMRAMRLGSVAYDFPGTEVPLAGGLGEGFACVGGFTLPRRHPTNPFRHKYHPDHTNFDRRNDPADPAFDPAVPLSGIEIRRHILIQFPVPSTEQAAKLPGDYGVLTLAGVYEETVTGLHKVPLVGRGTIILSRISNHGTLNE